MKTKHTQGEWESKFSETDNATVIRTKGTKNFIAEVQKGRSEEIEANAKLIAAAPQLLEALIKLSGEIAKGTKGSTLQEITMDAISKAK